jgi:hypothetical protein
MLTNRHYFSLYSFQSNNSSITESKGKDEESKKYEASINNVFMVKIAL